MAHRIHVSHYADSSTWRTDIAPEDRSWLVRVDVTGAPHMYLATEVQEDDTQTTTTYTPCVRAMLRADAEAGRSLLPGIAGTEKFSIQVWRSENPDRWIAVSGDLSEFGETREAAFGKMLARLPVAMPKPAADKIGPGVSVIRVYPTVEPNQWVAANELGHAVGQTKLEAITNLLAMPPADIASGAALSR